MTAGGAFAAGSVVVVRDEEWIVSSCEPAGDGWKVSCVGSSELVASVPATFFTELDEITSLDPADAELVADDSPYFRRSRLWVEAVLRKTPVPLHDQRLTVSPHMLLDRLDFQRQAVAQALDPARLRPRLLIADAVGLGKTLEIGMILAELARRGRAQRVLVVTPRHVLEQMQHELWTRFALPLVRLDSDGIQSVRQQLPASRNPFTYYPKVIVSIDTLKSARYRAHLERHRWDVVVIDESHNVTNSATRNYKLASILAPNTEALILASATPHNGKKESFAELIGLLDPTAIVDRSDYDVHEIGHLFIRRHRHSPEVAREVGHMWAERPEPEVIGVAANAAEDAVADELSQVWLHPAGSAPIAGAGRQLFPWVLAKAFLSSPAALVETVEARQKTLAARGELHGVEGSALARLAELAAAAQDAGSAKLDALVAHLGEIGVGAGSDVRVVLFSERVATLNWLRAELPRRLRLQEDGVRGAARQAARQGADGRGEAVPAGGHADPGVDHRGRRQRGGEPAQAVPSPRARRHPVEPDPDRAAQRAHRPVRPAASAADRRAGVDDLRRAVQRGRAGAEPAAGQGACRAHRARRRRVVDAAARRRGRGGRDPPRPDDRHAAGRGRARPGCRRRRRLGRLLRRPRRGRCSAARR